MRIFLLLCWLCNIKITMIDAQFPPHKTKKTTKPPRTRTTPSTLSYQQLLELEKFQKEEKFRFEYNPSWGLEPYWADGDHILTTFKEDLSKNITTTKAPMVCGEECNFMLQKITHVCAHKTSYNTINGCTGQDCSGKPGENIDVGFKTFNTYCEFLDAECQDTFTQGRWSLIYVGKCQKTENIFLPLWGGWQPLTRMNKHFSEFYSRHPKTTLPTTITFGSTTRKHK